MTFDPAGALIGEDPAFCPLLLLPPSRRPGASKLWSSYEREIPNFQGTDDSDPPQLYSVLRRTHFEVLPIIILSASASPKGPLSGLRDNHKLICSPSISERTFCISGLKGGISRRTTSHTMSKSTPKYS